uniref:Stress-response A/B barrel domain-containing protein n=1 Tax=Lotharella globosa TaxID=91324 RepID=A0A6V3K2A3_9EUKA
MHLSFHVLEGSRLAVYSGEDANHLFSFDAPMGKTMAFKRHGNMMVDITGAIPPFPAVHGVMNIGKGNYREILVETKPCKGVPQNETAALRYDKERLRRALLTQTEPTVVAAYDEARSIEGVRASAIIGYSKSVNHESERALAQGFSHGMLYTLDEVSRELTTTSSADTMVFDFYPVAVKDPGVAEEGMQRVKHMVFVQFKIDAPVGKLVAGYIGLTTKISEMKGFEWGPIANKLGDEEKGKGFQYGFVTTFNSVEDCTAYNEHDAHKEYVNEVVPYAEDLLVFDILEHNSSE